MWQTAVRATAGQRRAMTRVVGESHLIGLHAAAIDDDDGQMLKLRNTQVESVAECVVFAVGV